MSPRRKRDQAKAIAYLRVSKDEQTLDAQRDAIEAWAFTEDVEVVAWFEDQGVSGSSDPFEREGLLDALEAISEKEVGLLVVSKRDRLCRGVDLAGAVAYVITKRGAKVITAEASEDTPAERLMRQIVDAFAEYELAEIRVRTALSLRSKRKRGHSHSGLPPYGWGHGEKGGKMVAVPEEQETLARILELRESGLSLAKIVTKLDAENRPARNRKRWWPTAIDRLVKRNQLDPETEALLG